MNSVKQPVHERHCQPMTQNRYSYLRDIHFCSWAVTCPIKTRLTARSAPHTAAEPTDEASASIPSIRTAPESMVNGREYGFL